MDHTQIKEARKNLGLSLSAMAEMLDTDATTVRRMEMAPDRASHRKPAPRMVRLIEAYLSGYRPADYPKTRRDLERDVRNTWAALLNAEAAYDRENQRGVRGANVSAELASISERIAARRAEWLAALEAMKEMDQ